VTLLGLLALTLAALFAYAGIENYSVSALLQGKFTKRT